MFVISLTYKVSLDLIDQHLADHIEYLDEQYAAGVFLASGRKLPRTGGVILARTDSREALDAILAGDPFHQHQLADYDVIEFVASRVADGLEALAEELF